MIQHGMGAFLGRSIKNGLVENFDSEAAWKDALATGVNMSRRSILVLMSTVSPMLILRVFRCELQMGRVCHSEA